MTFWLLCVFLGWFPNISHLGNWQSRKRVRLDTFRRQRKKSHESWSYFPPNKVLNNKDRHWCVLLPTRKMANQTRKQQYFLCPSLRVRFQAIPCPWSCRKTAVLAKECSSAGALWHASLMLPSSTSSAQIIQSRSAHRGNLFQAQLPHQTQKVSHRHMADKIMLIVKTHTILCTH